MDKKALAPLLLIPLLIIGGLILFFVFKALVGLIVKAIIWTLVFAVVIFIIWLMIKLLKGGKK